jgi:hypothetical protein
MFRVNHIKFFYFISQVAYIFVSRMLHWIRLWFPLSIVIEDTLLQSL